MRLYSKDYIIELQSLISFLWKPLFWLKISQIRRCRSILYSLFPLYAAPKYSEERRKLETAVKNNNRRAINEALEDFEPLLANEELKNEEKPLIDKAHGVRMIHFYNLFIAESLDSFRNPKTRILTPRHDSTMIEFSFRRR